MNMAAILDQVKQHPEIHRAGMILCHNGVVRQTSRDGQEVTGLKVSVDHAILDRIVSEQKKTPGIVDIQVWINEDKDLVVGDDVMFIAVAGDIRETVIQTLTQTLNQIKSTATSKTQFFKGE